MLKSKRLPQEAETMLTVEEVANRLRLSQRAVWRLISQKILPSFKFGRARRVRKSDLDAFIRSNLD